MVIQGESSCGVIRVHHLCGAFIFATKLVAEYAYFFEVLRSLRSCLPLPRTNLVLRSSLLLSVKVGRFILKYIAQIWYLNGRYFQELFSNKSPDSGLLMGDLFFLYREKMVFL